MNKKKIAPEVNRARVKESMERTGTERLNLYLPNGTTERIKRLGQKPGTFARTLVLDELAKIEKLNIKK
ncbi:MAG: hypothetical protein NC548_45435 [Lachnospiraceae bacterium]|nr:hypothetical protein [Lachnospiraceae bacterium]